MPQRITAVLFDAGFTLVDLVRPVADIYLEAARELGVEIETSAFGLVLKRQWKTLESDYRKKNPDLTSSEEFERAAWRNFTMSIASEIPALADRHGDWHHRLVQHFDDPDAWRPAPHAAETLKSLNDAGIRTAVVSNWHSALPPILQVHGLSPMLEFALTSAEAGRKKPHPEIFDLALSRLGVAAELCAYVGDSWNDDVVGALDSGLKPIYLHRSNEAPPADPRVQVIQSLGEVPSIL